MFFIIIPLHPESSDSQPQQYTDKTTGIVPVMCGIYLDRY